MKKELEHFYIGNSYGGNQDWFRSFMMRLGGCGAETACDSSIYFALHRNIKEAYPFDAGSLTRKEYVDFAHIMEKYLWPRMSGIDRLDIFIDGYSKYLHDRGIDSISVDALSGNAPYEEAEAAVRRQIDAGLPIPTLVLNHREHRFSDYVWHWFLINGYDMPGDEHACTDLYRSVQNKDHDTDANNSGRKDEMSDAAMRNNVQVSDPGKTDEVLYRNYDMRVKAVTYSSYEWLDFRRLWDTGYARRGGLILYNL